MLDPSATASLPEVEPTAETQEFVDATRGTLGLQDAEAACLARRLEQRSDLKGALLAESSPQASTRWIDYTDLAADCIRTTTGATNFANGVQAQANGSLSIETLTCLRDHYANLSPEDTAAIIRNALTPGTIDPHATQKYLEVFRSCGVDPAGLPAEPK